MEVYPLPKVQIAVMHPVTYKLERVAFPSCTLDAHARFLSTKAIRVQGFESTVYLNTHFHLR